MRRDFRGKLCAYCAKAECATRDHVFAREFFLERHRGNLPVAPACARCNGRKSELELYLTATLPFGARHTQAVEALQTGIPKRLQNNRRLHKHLQQTIEPAWVQEGSGLFLPTSSAPFEGEKLEELLKYIAYGLAWHHWKAYVAPEWYASVMFMPDTLGMAFQQIVRSWRVGANASNNLGNGTVEYEGVQAADSPGLTVWLIAMFGGVMLTDRRTRIADRPAETSSRWWVITGPPEIAAQIEGMKSDH